MVVLVLSLATLVLGSESEESAYISARTPRFSPILRRLGHDSVFSIMLGPANASQRADEHLLKRDGQRLGGGRAAAKILLHRVLRFREIFGKGFAAEDLRPGIDELELLQAQLRATLGQALGLLPCSLIRPDGAMTMLVLTPQRLNRTEHAFSPLADALNCGLLGGLAALFNVCKCFICFMCASTKPRLAQALR
jgi:hypothetical protein